MARRPHAPLRNGAGDQPSVVEVAMAEADDDNVVYPLTGNDDLRAAGLVLEDDDDIREDAAALLGINVGSGSATIDLDADDGGGGAATTTRTRFGSTSTDGTSSVGKRKYGVWVDFEEICEIVNGNSVRIAAICKMCKSRLSARSAVGTGHLIRHQKSCRKKTDHAARVQSRLALNPDGLHNWVYDPAVARTELCRLIARLNLPLSIGETQA
jgi:hypothetical protein